MRGNILVIDDEIDVFEDLEESLPAHNLFYAGNLPKIRDIFKRKDIDLAIVDLNIKVNGNDRFSGLKYIKTIRDRYPTVTVVAHSGHRDIARITTAIQNGAAEYFYKGTLDSFSLEFRKKINHLIAAKKKRDAQRAKLKNEIWGKSPQIVKLKAQIKQLAVSRASFFLLGEAGLQMQNIINYLHYISLHYTESRPAQVVDFAQKKRKKLLRIMSNKQKRKKHAKATNKTARKPHKKKSFLKLAHKGILHIKNLSNIDMGLQAALLEMIRTQKFLDSKESLSIQYVFSLEKNPNELIREGKLHPELYHALVQLKVPPLRERRSDIPLLIAKWMEANGFPEKINSQREQPFVGEKIMDAFRQYAYPENITELLGLLEKMMSHHRSKYPKKDSITQTWEYLEKPVGLASIPSALFVQREQLGEMDIEVGRLELNYIERALDLCEGKKEEAAKLLNIKNSDLLKKSYINKYSKKYPALIRQFPMIVKCYKLND